MIFVSSPKELANRAMYWNFYGSGAYTRYLNLSFFSGTMPTRSQIDAKISELGLNFYYPNTHHYVGINLVTAIEALGCTHLKDQIWYKDGISKQGIEHDGTFFIDLFEDEVNTVYDYSDGTATFAVLSLSYNQGIKQSGNTYQRTFWFGTVGDVSSNADIKLNDLNLVGTDKISCSGFRYKFNPV